MERRLRDQYFSDMERLCKDLTSDNHSVAVELAEAPEQIRGFGHVKLAAAEGAEHGRNAILGKLAAIKRQDRAA